MKQLKMPKRMPKQLPFIISAGLVVIVGGYIWWSVVAWSKYEQTYTVKQNEVQQTLDTVWNMPADTNEQKQAKLASLSAAVTEIDRINLDTCNQNVLISWQRIIQQNGEHEKACKEGIQSIKERSVSIKPSVEFLQQAETLAKSMSQAPSLAEVTESDFDGQLNAWRNVQNSIKNMSASDRFEVVKQSAQSSVEGIIKAWEEVAAAHKAKDKTRYTKAVQALAAAYDGLEDVSRIHTEQLSILVSEIKK